MRMYVFIRRTLPPPSMLIFDASNRDQREVRRLRTNTPLQVLSMLNDPTVQEASRVMAEELTLEKQDIESKLEKAFRTIICRRPESGELKVLNSYFEEELAYFNEHKDKAKELLNVGEFPSKASKSVSETAAMMHCVQLIYNLEEALMRI